MATKVKISKPGAVTAMSSTLKPSAWQMDPSPICDVIESYDLKSKTGQKIGLLLLEYDKKCAQAKVDLINELKKLLALPR